jgi:hypothetical protein
MSTSARSFGRLVVWAVLAGSIVAVVAAVMGVQNCDSVWSTSECRELVRTLSIRVGLLTAVVTAIMALYVRGLGRMSEQDEADRRERRMGTLGQD